MGVYQEYIQSKGDGTPQDENAGPKEAAKDGETSENKA